MCAIAAGVAGVERIVLASPPGPDGKVDPLVLAAAELCGIEEIYAMGGAQAIFALAFGTETIEPVDVIAGPGNAWVREAKRTVSGTVGIDSLAGPSELMVVAGDGTDPEWAALDLCAQAEHGAEGPLVAVAVEEKVLADVASATERVAAERAGIGDAPLALVLVPDLSDAIDLANAFAPEHLELFEEDAALLAGAGRRRRGVCSSAATERPPSATTWPVPIMCCPRAVPAVSRARSVPPSSAAGSRLCRFPPTPRRSLPHTSRPSPGRRDSRFTPSPR